MSTVLKIYTKNISYSGRKQNLGQDNERAAKKAHFKNESTNVAKAKHFANWIIKINYPTAYAFQLKQFLSVIGSRYACFSSLSLSIKATCGMHIDFYCFSCFSLRLFKASCKLLASMQVVDKSMKTMELHLLTFELVIQVAILKRFVMNCGDH